MSLTKCPETGSFCCPHYSDDCSDHNLASVCWYVVSDGTINKISGQTAKLSAAINKLFEMIESYSKKVI